MIRRETLKDSLFIFLGVFTLGIFVSILHSPSVQAASWNAGNIMDELTFSNTTVMDPSSIQNFLNSKVPVCDTYGTQPSEYGGGTRSQWAQAKYGQSTFTCLRNYSEGGKSAAQIIYDIGQKYTINPQVLIVLLQKEQGLVTDTWPLNIQYRTAAGYGCPDTAPCDTQYYGLTNQLDWAAKMFRAIMNNSPTWYTPYVQGNNSIRYNPQASCGSSTVNIQNRSTQALYNYTPYQPNQAALAAGYGTAPPCGAYGNRNFWLYFNDWFGNTQVAGKWLRQSPNGQVWLVVEGQMPNGSYARKKFKLTSWDIYLAYFLQYEPVVPVSYEYLVQFDDEGALGTRTIGKSYAQMQFANNGERYYIPDSATCDAWGFDCFNTNLTKTIPGTEFLERLTGMAKPIPPVMAYNGVVYKLQNGTKLPILDGGTFTDLGYKWDNILYNTHSINAEQPIGAPQITRQIVTQFNQNSPVVVYDPSTTQFHKVPNYDIFSAWGMYQYAILNPANSTYTTSPPATTSPDLSIWASDGSGHKYIIDQGRKIDVTSVSDLPSVTWQTTAKDLLNKIPTAVFGKYLWEKETGAVYVLENGQKRLVPSWDNFVGLGLQMSQLLPISSYTASQIPSGPQKLANGMTFVTGTGIWVVSGQQKFHMPKWDYFTYLSLNPGLMTSNQANLESAYTGTDELSVLVKNSSGAKYVLQNGTRLTVDSSTQAAWGIADNSFVQLNDSILSRLPIVGSLKNFVNNPSGGLFYANNGQKRHILSFQSYINLGGNSSNTPVVDSSFLNASPNGSDIN